MSASAIAPEMLVLAARSAHLSDSQRAAFAVEFESLLSASALQRSHAQLRRSPGQPIPPAKIGRSRDIAGRMFAVSGGYVGQAKRLKRISAQLFARVLCGELTLPAARRIAAAERAAVPMHQRPGLAAEHFRRFFLTGVTA
jgi:hypothetical protein